MFTDKNTNFSKYVNHNCTYTTCMKNFLYTKNYKFGNEQKWQGMSTNQSLYWLTLHIQTDTLHYIIIDL
jgi:hypothetical protein